jgi:diguanylate cyclase (GGDEF)-like protein/PAS domain S-box-containing protein
MPSFRFPSRHGFRSWFRRLGGLYGHSIYGALLLVVVGGLVIPAMVGSYLMVGVQEQRAAADSLNESLQRNADILALGMQESLWNMNTEAARSLVDSVMRDPAVVHVAVRSQLDAGFVDVRSKALAGSRLYRAERDIVVRGERIGSITVEMDDTRSQQELRAKQARYGGVLAVQLCVSLLLIMLFLRRRLAAPLRTLMAFSDRLSRGDFATPLALAARDELGRLGSQMERMRGAIRQLFDDVARREERFRTIVTQVPGAVFRVRPGGPVDFVSDAIQEITGYPAARFMEGTTDAWSDIICPEDRRMQSRVVKEALQAGRAYQLEYRIFDAAGVERWVLESGQPQGVPGSGAWVDGIISDISERKHDEMRIEALLAEQGVILDNVMFGVLFSREGRLVSVNRRCEELLGYASDALVGAPESDIFISEDDCRLAMAAFYPHFARGENHSEERRLRRRDGSTVWCLVSGTALDPRRPHEGAVWVIADISEARESQEKLDHLAHHDALTALPNRLLFHDRLQHALARAARDEEQLAVLFIDLDRFKNVNDTLGHHVGDELLKQVAGALAGRLRDGDTLARLGGDEFIVLLENVDGEYGTRLVADKLVAMFEQPFTVSDYELFVTCSVGVSLFPRDGADLNLLVRNADVAMYQAKARGRNGYQFYAASMNGEGVERLRLESLLRRAIDRNEISLAYQPQVEIDSGRMIGVEALVRWHSPELGQVSPARFIPLAEDIGFISQLGKWVLAEACRQMVRWQEAGLDVPKMAVNLSVRQFERGGIAGMVGDVLAETGLAPQRLQLEVTESVIMNTGDALVYINDLRRIGVGLAIDDFGTGYSSLAYLKQLPVQTLKIDRSFIKDISTDANDEAIAIAIIQLGKSLNLSVIAEGVENEEQAAFLLRHGCTRAQGYLYSRPVTAAQILERWGQGQHAGHEHGQVEDREG